MRSSVLTTAGNGRLRAAPLRVTAAALVASGLLAFAAGHPPAAHADFDSSAPECEGSPIQAEGSSLQKTAQNKFWIAQIFDSASRPGCGSSGLGSAPEVKYQSTSSGCGLDSVGAGDPASGCSFESEEATKGHPDTGFRAKNIRIGATDFAPSPEEQAHINSGPAGNQSSGQIHVIPVAIAAITVVVHFPEGCALQNPEPSGNGNTSTGGKNDPGAADGTGDKFSNQTLRVHLKAETLEAIWEGHDTTWGQIVPQADFLEAASEGVAKTQAECAATPIIRIVRSDTSGTTYNFKNYLSLLPSPLHDGGSALWTSGAVGATNTTWPIAGASNPGTPVPVNSGNVCVDGSHICQALLGKGSSLALAVKDTNGSIGYLDLATAREEGFDMTPNPSGEPGKAGFKETENDRDYWIPLESVTPSASSGGAGTVHEGTFFEPTAEPTAHFNVLHPAPNGANCSNADYRGIPTTPSDPTLGDWSNAIATGNPSSTGYPVCAITYDLAFDDDAPVYGNEASKEKEARTVKDYLTSVVSGASQGGLTTFDYGILPNSPSAPLLADAENGVAAIGWNKTSGSGGGGGGGGTVTPPPTVTHVVTPPGVVVTPAPSNAFSIASGKVKGKNIVLSLVLPGAGKVQIKATGGGVTVSNVTASVSGGQGTATLPISSAALKKLAKAKSKKLSVSITVTFTPTGGTAATQTKTLTITQASIAGKPKKKSKKKGKKKG